MHLLNEEKCGDAVKFLQESKSEFIKCEKFCKQYRHLTTPWLKSSYCPSLYLYRFFGCPLKTGSWSWTYSQTRWINFLYQLWKRTCSCSWKRYQIKIPDSNLIRKYEFHNNFKLNVKMALFIIKRFPIFYQNWVKWKRHTVWLLLIHIKLLTRGYFIFIFL